LSSYRRFPDEIFVGSNTWNDSLRKALDQPKPLQNEKNDKPRKAGVGPRKARP
jgi:hypothetical protein